MRRHKKYKPFVRLANGSEHSESFRDAFRLAFYQSLGKPFYVMVQHGFPNKAIAVGASKRDVQHQPIIVELGKKTFTQWARSVQRYAAKRRPKQICSDAN